MTGAFLYLFLTSARNSARRRLDRLRQPRYLIGAIVGVGYFYFFLFRHTLKPVGTVTPSPELAALVEPIGALALFAFALYGWIIGRERAALKFTEAEVAFLFPAPVSRRALIHFRLLRSQFSILVSAFLLMLLFRRGSAFGGNGVTHAIGWWTILSFLNLHLLGASFARERLLDLGLNPGRRRIIITVILGIVTALAWKFALPSLPSPQSGDTESITTLARYVNRIIESPPLGWILAPFAWIVRPYLAQDVSSFLAAMVPALLLLVAHYAWVVRSDVAFEEASIALAARRAELVAALRSGRRTSPLRAPHARREPFALAGTGGPWTAFLWKGLIASGPVFRFRTWIALCVVIVSGLTWAARDPSRIHVLRVVGGFSIAATIWLFLLGPMFMRRNLQQMLGHLDITKSLPLSGWQIVAGELATPTLIMTGVELLILLAGVLSFGATGSMRGLGTAGLLGGAAAAVIVAPVLSALMLCIPYAGVILFPAWAQGTGAAGGGIELAGQRLIFVAGYVIVLGLAALPATILGGGAYLATAWLAGPIAGFAAGFALLMAVLAAELVGAVAWLGRRLEQFDLSSELPR